MKHIKSILLLLMVALLPLSAFASEEKKEGGESIDIPEIVLEHLADAYEWHICSYEGKHLSIPLPIIVRSSARSTASTSAGRNGSTVLQVW